MSFALGVKTIKKLCVEQDSLAWQRAKLSPALFKPYEVELYEWVYNHLKIHHVLPQIDTVAAYFPDVASTETPEPVSYYVKLLENRYFYECINKANLDSQQILKDNQDNHEQALDVLRNATNDIMYQKYRVRILDVGKEGKSLVLNTYHSVHAIENMAVFGWPYMDEQGGGVMPGELVSIVGRPSMGKTFLSLWIALQNWKNQNVLFASMEMMNLPIAQRIAAMYTGSNISQLKTAGYGDVMYKKFAKALTGLKKEKHKFYVVDGNLAANAEEIYILADMLQCKVVVIDGAYLLRHKNIRLDRYTRVAENTELIKRYSTDLDVASYCSWQLSRKSTEKQKKASPEETGLEDIGYSDAIGQISSIVLGLFQEDGVETMKQRKIRVMKGRNGEIGQFSIAWNFIDMLFDQTDPPIGGVKEQNQELMWI